MKQGPYVPNILSEDAPNPNPDDEVSLFSGEDPLTEEPIWRSAPRRTRGFLLLDFLMLDHLRRHADGQEPDPYPTYIDVPELEKRKSRRRLEEAGLIAVEPECVGRRYLEFDGLQYWDHAAMSWRDEPMDLADSKVREALARAARDSWERYDKEPEEDA